MLLPPRQSNLYRGHWCRLKPSTHLPKVCICLMKADSLSFCLLLYEVLGPVCVNWLIHVKAWHQSGHRSSKWGLGSCFEVVLILISKFRADRPFTEFSLREGAGRRFFGAVIGGSDYKEALPTSPAEELGLYSKLHYFKISGILISNSIWGSICSKYVAYLATG